MEDFGSDGIKPERDQTSRGWSAPLKEKVTALSGNIVLVRVSHGGLFPSSVEVHLNKKVRKYPVFVTKLQGAPLFGPRQAVNFRYFNELVFASFELLIIGIADGLQRLNGLAWN